MKAESNLRRRYVLSDQYTCAGSMVQSQTDHTVQASRAKEVSTSQSSSWPREAVRCQTETLRVLHSPLSPLETCPARTCSHVPLQIRSAWTRTFSSLEDQCLGLETRSLNTELEVLTETPFLVRGFELSRWRQTREWTPN